MEMLKREGQKDIKYSARKFAFSLSAKNFFKVGKNDPHSD
jgi:hypothetical protein